MQANLVVADGKYHGRIIPVSKTQFIIGRHRECQLRVTSPKVSVHHCALLLRDDGVWVKDLNSTNGTFVNDEAVSGERKLRPDDTLRVGPLVVRLQFDKVGVPKPARKKPAKTLDESAIARILSADSRAPGASGLLFVGEESVYGSTIMKPTPLDEAPSDAKPKKKRKRP